MLMFELWFSSISASVPAGPVSERSATLPTTVMSPPPLPGFGSGLSAADRSHTFWELITGDATSASAFPEKKHEKKERTLPRAQRGRRKSPETKRSASGWLALRLCFNEKKRTRDFVPLCPRV